MCGLPSQNAIFSISDIPWAAQNGDRCVTLPRSSGSVLAAGWEAESHPALHGMSLGWPCPAVGHSRGCFCRKGTARLWWDALGGQRWVRAPVLALLPVRVWRAEGMWPLFLGPLCWPWTCMGKGKVVCNPACGHQRAAGQPLSLRWSLQRSREGTREMGPGVKETRSKGDRARYAGDSRNVSCTVTGGSAMPTGAQQCPGSRRWHWKPKRILHPWVLGGHPVGSVPLEMGSSADGDVGDHVRTAGLAWHR